MWRLVILGSVLALPVFAFAICGDVNGDGRITVTDGVNVLRGAAGLPATLQCEPGPSATATPGPAECANGHDCLADDHFFECLCFGAEFHGDCGSGGDDSVDRDGLVLRVGRCEAGVCRRAHECSDSECRDICEAHDCGSEADCIGG